MWFGEACMKFILGIGGAAILAVVLGGAFAPALEAG